GRGFDSHGAESSVVTMVLPRDNLARDRPPSEKAAVPLAVIVAPRFAIRRRVPSPPRRSLPLRGITRRAIELLNRGTAPRRGEARAAVPVGASRRTAARA